MRIGGTRIHCEVVVFWNGRIPTRQRMKSNVLNDVAIGYLYNVTVPQRHWEGGVVILLISCPRGISPVRRYCFKPLRVHAASMSVECRMLIPCELWGCDQQAPLWRRCRYSNLHPQSPYRFLQSQSEAYMRSRLVSTRRTQRYARSGRGIADMARTPQLHRMVTKGNRRNQKEDNQGKTATLHRK